MKRITLRALFALSFGLLALAHAGCDCGGDLSGDPCEDDDDCPSSLVCQADRCVAPGTDAGPRRRDTGPNPCVDADSDGFCADNDCDESDPERGGPEVCDEVDNDCDGEVDEGFSALCPNCASGCEVSMVPGPGGWMPDDGNSEGVIVDDDDAITLGRNEARSFAVWVANMDEGTVSKLNSTTGVEEARYPTVGTLSPAGVRPWQEVCGWYDSPTGNCPSRTAVDQNFDAYVANRAFQSQGSVTKYANREDDCIDRNGNGMIDTSRDLDGNGQIDIGSAEFVGPDDECILWTTAVGELRGVPRALAIGVAPPDGFVGDVWVGLFDQRQACRLDAATGATLGCVDISDFRPYGMAADSQGRIWTVDRSGARRDVLGYISPSTMSFVPAPQLPGSGCAVPYGMTVDGEGDVFMANQCDPSLWRYRPSTMEWTALDTGAEAFSGTPRGVAADETNLWVALSHGGDEFGGGETNRVRQYLLSDLSLVQEHVIPGTQPIGIGVSFDNSVWAICRSSNNATRLDPVTGAWTTHPVGVQPYTYSDFIGFGLNVFAEPRGRYAFVVEGCSNGNSVWTGAEYVAEVPPNTSVTVWARTSDDRAALSTLPYVGPFTGNPADFTMAPGPLTPGQFIEVELRLSTEDRMAAPRVFSINVAGTCEPVLD